uniref:Reverse transcriptase n=1 Tax=Tanacetum cinerariifolium TaxID=118510 RepID=A0A6L2M099_TANCI|nr:reverse transcriptase [Tanacetum cinerariifolium]
MVNDITMLSKEGKVASSKALDVGLIVTECSGTKSDKQDTSNKSGNDADTKDAYIRPVNDQAPLAEKCVFNANHDACIIKFLKEVNSRVKVQSPKTRNSNNPVEPKDSYSETWWIPTGRIFHTFGLRWVPTGKIFTSSTTKVDCKPPNGSNKDITNPYKCDQTLNVRAGAVDPTLFTQKARNDLLLVQIYVDDIIYTSTNTAMCNELANMMTTKFKMSMMRADVILFRIYKFLKVPEASS